MDDPQAILVYRKNPKYEAIRLAELERHRALTQIQHNEDQQKQAIADRIAKRTQKNRRRRASKQKTKNKDQK